MILAKNEQGVITLNGEPLQDWYTKRGISPVEMRYVEWSEDKCKMCLLGAIGFAAVEANVTLEQYKKNISHGVSGMATRVATLTGDDRQDLFNIELGFLSRESDMLDVQKSPMQQLGYAAQLQLRTTIGIDKR